MSWGGVKKQTNIEDIKFWCDEMGIENYTINSQGEIDVDGYVNLSSKNIIELPYKFGTVTGFFSLSHNNTLISLKNCPYKVERYFNINFSSKLESLEGCPKIVGTSFFCRDCKRKFSPKEVKALCKVSKGIYCDVK